MVVVRSLKSSFLVCLDKAAPLQRSCTSTAYLREGDRLFRELVDAAVSFSFCFASWQRRFLQQVEA